MSYDSKYTGAEVEELLDQMAEGGVDGVGITSVVQTTTSTADGGSNVVTVTLTDGTTSTFTVKNGSKGSQGEKGETGSQGIQGEQGPKGDTGATGEQGPKGDKGDTGAAGTNGTNGKDGADGDDGATFTPSVDSDGNLSWSNNKGLTNPPTVNIKGPKGDNGVGGLVNHGVNDTTFSLTPNVLHIWDTVEALTLTLVSGLDNKVNEYTFQFTSGATATTLSLPSSVKFPSELTIEANKIYQISIVNNLALISSWDA